MNEPIRAEWASGKKGPVPTSLLLFFFFGAAVLLAMAVIGSQVGIGGPKGIPTLWSGIAGGWAIGAVLLGFATRRDATKLLQAVALIWWLPFWLIVIEGGRLGLY